MLSLSAASLSFTAPAVPVHSSARASVSMMDVNGLKDQAKALNPVVGFWDPLNLSGGEFWGDSNEATIGFLQFWRENSYVLKADGEAHYMRGGKPGYFPTFDQLPHPVPFNLFDPFKLSKNKTPEQKA